jgi:hypothetical protein
MNAYELADFVEISNPNDKTHQTIATMLRQQHAEIESLRNNGYKTQYELLRLEFLQQRADFSDLQRHIPSKTLTDEEIDNLIMEVAEKPTDEDLHDFARAILRKTQE